MAQQTYDYVEILGSAGERSRYDAKQYEQLPLGERVKYILGGRVKFFKSGGEEIPASAALRGH